MKKSFYFALALTAGLFASCSSDDIAQAPQGALDANGNEGAAIHLSIANGGATTRGSGSIGSTTAENQWAGQKVKVFMLKKGALDIAVEDPTKEYNATTNPYVLNNQEFTVGNEQALILDVTAAATTEQFRYFPGSGEYDFWGYRTDGAETDDPAVSGTHLQIPFTLDGSQDILTGKAVLKDTQIDEESGKVIPAAGSAYTEPFSQDKIYSAYSARRGINPQIKFKHELSRLTFKVKGASLTDCIPAENATNDEKEKGGVKVQSISINSKTTGTLVIAYTDENAPASISWGDATDDLFVKQRAKDVTTPQAGTFYPVKVAKDDNETVTYYYNFVTVANNTIELDTELDYGEHGTVTFDGDLEVYDSNETYANGKPKGNKKKISAIVTATEADSESDTYYIYVKTADLVEGVDVDLTGDLVDLNEVTPTYEETAGTTTWSWTEEGATEDAFNTAHPDDADKAAFTKDAAPGDAVGEDDRTENAIWRFVYDDDNDDQTADAVVYRKVKKTTTGATYTFDEVPVGESLLLPAGVDQYVATIKLKQWVKTSTVTPHGGGEAVEHGDWKETTITKTIKLGTSTTGGQTSATKFAAGKSYNIVFVVNGLSSVDVTADDSSLDPWAVDKDDEDPTKEKEYIFTDDDD